MHQNAFDDLASPEPAGGAYSAPPDSLAGLRGGEGVGRGGKKEGRGKSGGKREKGQGLFPAGTPGNGVPKVILTVGTAFSGTAFPGTK